MAVLPEAGGGATGGRRRCYQRAPAVLRATYGRATRGRLRCYGWPAVVLPEAAEGAIRGRQRCCEPPMVVLRATGGRAARGRRRCCHRPPAVLGAAYGSANKGWLRCYEQLALPAVLPEGGGGATSGRRSATRGRRLCYEQPMAVLRIACGSATRGWPPCYERQAAVLQRRRRWCEPARSLTGARAVGTGVSRCMCSGVVAFNRSCALYYFRGCGDSLLAERTTEQILRHVSRGGGGGFRRKNPPEDAQRAP